MSGVELHVNHRHGTAAPGTSLFDAARSFGVFVPTSCITQGKCKECMVEIAEGMEHLSARTAAESHLSGSLRLSCQARVLPGVGPADAAAAGAGGAGTAAAPRVVRCHTMRRFRFTCQAEKCPRGINDVKLCILECFFVI